MTDQKTTEAKHTKLRDMRVSENREPSGTWYYLQSFNEEWQTWEDCGITLGRTDLTDVMDQVAMACNAYYRDQEIIAELKGALEMVRDADEDCKRDGLETIPPIARSKIDAAMKAAEQQEKDAR